MTEPEHCDSPPRADFTDLEHAVAREIQRLEQLEVEQQDRGLDAPAVRPEHSYSGDPEAREKVERIERWHESPEQVECLGDRCCTNPRCHRHGLGGELERAEETAGRSADTAAEMHALSVRLWNELWAEAGEDPQFVDREDVERVQAILAGLAWPRSTR